MFSVYFHVMKKEGVKTEMKIPSLCDVYPAFSHIRCRSVYNHPPHSSYSRMRAAWSQRLTADERKDRTAKMVMKQGKDGKRQEFPAGTPTTSRDLFCHRTTLAPTSAAPCGEDVSGDVLGQPWEETNWEDNSFLPNYRSCFWCGLDLKGGLEEIQG